MKMVRKFASLALALMLILSLSATAFAAGGSVTYSGHNIFGFAPGSSYTSTDLFGSFKGVMPGDVRTQTVTVSNTASCCDFIKVYLKAVPHGQDANSLSASVAASETVASMQDFLSKLNLSVQLLSGDGTVTQIYNASPDKASNLAVNNLLATLRKNQSVELQLTLTVPIDLDNEYASRVGEVDWVFTIEEFDDAKPDTPKTGDDTSVLPYVIVLAVGAAGMFILLAARRKKEN